MARGRTQSRSDSDSTGVKDRLDKASQQTTSISSEERLQNIEETLKVILMYVKEATGFDFDKDDLE